MSINVKVPTNLSGVITFLGKVGGLVVGFLGLAQNDVQHVMAGFATFTATHGIDSIWNSPSGEHPAP